MYDHMILTFKTSEMTHAQAIGEYYVPSSARTDSTERKEWEAARTASATAYFTREGPNSTYMHTSADSA